MNLAWILLRAGVACLVLTILFLSQRFWYRALWRVTSFWGRIWLRWGVRILYFSGLTLIILAVADNLPARSARFYDEAHCSGPLGYRYVCRAVVP